MGAMKRLFFTLVLAAVLWAVMFSPWTAPHVNFWLMMSVSACTLMAVSLAFRPDGLRQTDWTWANVGWGVGIAFLLWMVFWTGDKVSSWLLPFARPQVELIYGMKSDYSPWLLSLLLLLLTGPAEELFWRGYVQRTLSERWSPNAGFVCTSFFYALVHAPSCNFMLLMAALVAGVVWGGLYRLYPRRLSALVVSHALWDAAVFIWFPI